MSEAEVISDEVPPKFFKLELHMHPGVKKIAEFMHQNLPANELCGVAAALHLLAPALWGQYDTKPVQPLELRYPPITALRDPGPRTQ
jgi:hypothetical protein